MLGKQLLLRLVRGVLERLDRGVEHLLCPQEGIPVWASGSRANGGLRQ